MAVNCKFCNELLIHIDADAMNIKFCKKCPCTPRYSFRYNFYQDDVYDMDDLIAIRLYYGSYICKILNDDNETLIQSNTNHALKTIFSIHGHPITPYNIKDKLPLYILLS